VFVLTPQAHQACAPREAARVGSQCRAHFLLRLEQHGDSEEEQPCRSLPVTLPCELQCSWKQDCEVGGSKPSGHAFWKSEKRRGEPCSLGARKRGALGPHHGPARCSGAAPCARYSLTPEGHAVAQECVKRGRVPLPSPEELQREAAAAAAAAGAALNGSGNH